MDLTKEAAQRIRELRMKRGYTQVYMAKKLGYSNSQRYANYEYGANKVSLATAKRIADILGVSVDDFFCKQVKRIV